MSLIYIKEVAFAGLQGAGEVGGVGVNEAFVSRRSLSLFEASLRVGRKKDLFVLFINESPFCCCCCWREKSYDYRRRFPLAAVIKSFTGADWTLLELIHDCFSSLLLFFFCFFVLFMCHVARVLSLLFSGQDIINWKGPFHQYWNCEIFHCFFVFFIWFFYSFFVVAVSVGFDWFIWMVYHFGRVLWVRHRRVGWIGRVNKLNWQYAN